MWQLDCVDIRDFGTRPAPHGRRYAGRRRRRHGDARRRARRGHRRTPASDMADVPLIYLTPARRAADAGARARARRGARRAAAGGPLRGHRPARDRRRAACEEISIGDYVLSGGELAAMVLIEACVRLLPGVLGADASLDEESFESGLLEYPQYTRPREWEGHADPRRAAVGRSQAHRGVAPRRSRAPDARAPAGSARWHAARDTQEIRKHADDTADPGTLHLHRHPPRADASRTSAPAASRGSARAATRDCSRSSPSSVSR